MLSAHRKGGQSDGGMIAGPGERTRSQDRDTAAAVFPTTGI